MSTGKTTAVIISIGILALGFFLISQTKKQSTLASELADAKNKSETLRRELAAQQGQQRQIDDEIAHVQSLITAEPDAEARLENAHRETLIRRNHADDEYASLFRKLRLPPDKLAILRELIQNYIAARSKATILSRKAGLADNSEVIAFALTDADSHLLQLLGAEGLEYFKSYMDVDALRHRRADTFGRQLDHLNLSLSDEQADELVKINTTLDGDSRRVGLENLTSRVWTDDEMHAAEKILSPAQFSILQECNRSADANNKIAEYHRAANEAGLIKSKTVEQLIQERKKR